MRRDTQACNEDDAENEDGIENIARFINSTKFVGKKKTKQKTQTKTIQNNTKQKTLNQAKIWISGGFSFAHMVLFGHLSVFCQFVWENLRSYLLICFLIVSSN